MQSEVRNTSYHLINSTCSDLSINYFLSFLVKAFLSAGIGGLVVVTLFTKGSISTVSSAFFLYRTPIGSPVSPRRALAITLFLNFNFLRLISARTTNIIMARIINVPITADQFISIFPPMLVNNLIFTTCQHLFNSHFWLLSKVLFPEFQFYTSLQLYLAAQFNLSCTNTTDQYCHS